MIDPWLVAEVEMKLEGYDVDRVPKYELQKHLWADGIFLWWTSHKRLPTAEELAADMFDEWDDPVSVEEAEHVLSLVKAQV